MFDEDPHFELVSADIHHMSTSTKYLYAKDSIRAELTMCVSNTNDARTAIVKLSTDSVQYRGYLSNVASDTAYVVHYTIENGTETAVQRAAIPALLDLISGPLMKAFKVDIRDAGCLQAFVREYA